jgi:hypothetical protein
VPKVVSPKRSRVTTGSRRTPAHRRGTVLWRSVRAQCRCRRRGRRSRSATSSWRRVSRSAGCCWAGCARRGDLRQRQGSQHLHSKLLDINLLLIVAARQTFSRYAGALARLPPLVVEPNGVAAHLQIAGKIAVSNVLRTRRSARPTHRRSSTAPHHASDPTWLTDRKAGYVRAHNLPTTCPQLQVFPVISGDPFALIKVFFCA